jgi:hypothetical protein
MLPLEGNEALQQVQDDWINWDQARNLPSYCAYETLPTDGVFVVTQSSARALCNRLPEGMTADHIQIVKPSSRDDPRYSRFATALRQTLATSPTPDRKAEGRLDKPATAVPVSLESFYLSEASDIYFEDKPFSCKFDGHDVRTFMQPAAIKENRALSLDFVFSNKSESDAIFKSLDVDVSSAEEVAGGNPGIVIPNHTYVVNLKHQLGIQPFPLRPVYRVPGHESGSFSIVLKPATEGVGLCWILQMIFHTSLGEVKSDRFSVIMSNFKRL